jgi:hypothetical protein
MAEIKLSDYTVPTSEAGANWLKCLEYMGRGAKDPTGIETPQGFTVEDLVSHAVVFRGNKAVTVPVEKLIKGDKVVQAVINEDLVGSLYDGDPEAITLKDATGRTFTRLGWYKDPTVGGRDGLRVVATSRIRRLTSGPGIKVLQQRVLK